MSIQLRAVLYLIFLLYLFLGIAFIVDIFMSSVETITSKKRKIRYPNPSQADQYLVIEIPIWSATIANLISPEILFLSLIEIIGNRFEAGELGPSAGKQTDSLTETVHSIVRCISFCLIYISREREKQIVLHLFQIFFAC